MGFRFRKSFGKGPFRMTISKSGIGYSVGGKGVRFTKKAGGGTRTTLSVPGTGLSYVKDSSKNKRKGTSNNMTHNTTTTSYTTQQNSPQFKYITDPNIEGAPHKMGFLRGLKYFIFGILSIFISFFVGMIVLCLESEIISDATFAWFFMGSLLTTIIILYTKTSKWRKNYMPLKQPISFEVWSDSQIGEDAFANITNGLSATQKTVYATILSYCDYGETDKVFTIPELNISLNTTINSSAVSKLYEFGFLVKPSRGHYALNMNKIEMLNAEYARIEAEKENRYKEFVKNCEIYNEKARAYNSDLMLKRMNIKTK